MRKTLPAWVIGLVLVASACASGPSGPQTYEVEVDAPSPEGKNFQYSTYFPGALKVRPGDSVTFRNASTQAPHTVTFGVESDRSNQPPVLLPDGTESSVVQMPCVSDDEPTAELTECPDAELQPYDGSGFWNSGFIAPAPAPEGPKEVTLELAEDIEPGTYSYVCILHAPMSGTIEVVEEDGERDTPEEVAETASEQVRTAQRGANRIEDPEPESEGDTVGVAAGWSEGVIAVNRFAPSTVEVEAGTTVRWTASSDFEPHTVTFGPDAQAGNPESSSFAPSGVRSGSNYTGGAANSGIFGAEGGPFPAGPFELTFTRAGEYKYVCILHPGMEGTINVE